MSTTASVIIILIVFLQLGVYCSTKIISAHLKEIISLLQAFKDESK